MIGNDLVDLGDAETQPGATHPRFDARVFAPAERAALAASAAPDRLRWSLWAAKEAAYKAARKCDARIAFSPARFVVELDGSATRGVVSHPTGEFLLWIEECAAYVHVIAVAFPAPVGTGLRACPGVRSTPRRAPRAGSHGGLPLRVRVRPALWSIGRASADPSAAVRALAIDALSVALGEDPTALAITRRGRIPQLERRGVPVDVDLSLSHHGRFVAFACDLSGEARL
jgi:phosphopantetheinyl transferase